MDICYVDEAGSAELLCADTPSSTPVLVIAGVIIPEEGLRSAIWEYVQVKKRYSPVLSAAGTKLSEVLAHEVKGSDLRADIRSGASRRLRRAFGVIDRVFDVLEASSCSLVARVLVKDEDLSLDDRVVYSAAISWICRSFHAHLIEHDRQGIVLLDSRTKVKNTPSVTAVATQMFRHGGDPLPRLLEAPVFGHSDSHVALQLADIVTSAVLFPCACSAYCSAMTWNHHAHPSYDHVRARYGPRIKRLQYRYFDAAPGHWKGGVHATNATGALRAVDLFAGGAVSPHLPGITLTPAPSSTEPELPVGKDATTA